MSQLNRSLLPAGMAIAVSHDIHARGRKICLPTNSHEYPARVMYDYVAGLSHESHVRGCNPCLLNLRIRRLGGKPVCKMAWKKASVLGSKPAAELFKLACSPEPQQQLCAILQSKQHSARLLEKEQRFVAALTDIEQDFGDAMPHLPFVKYRKDPTKSHHVVYLPAGLYSTKREVYLELVELGLIDRVDESTFYRWWARNFYYLKLKAYIPFAKCEECLAFRHKILSCNKEQRAELRVLQKQHRDLLCLLRTRSVVRSLIAERLTSEFLHITMDGMDQSKTALPHLGSLTHNKLLDKTGKPLKVSLLGCIVAGRGFYGLWTLPRYPHGANLACSGLLLVLNKLQEREGRLPPHLVLQLDNCGRENKNETVFATLSYLVRLGVFQRKFC